MRPCALLLLIPVSIFAAVDGTIVNQSTGQPQANVIVSLIQPGASGMQTLGSTKSDTQGKFKFDKTPGAGPTLVQAVYGGVPYNKMIPPGSASTGLEIPVYNATTKSGTAELNQHMVLLQPGEASLKVNEMYLMRNATKETFNDAAHGTVQFYVPEGHGEVGVTVSAPGGMPVRRPAEPAGAANTFKVSYPIRPGETRFDVSYALAGAQKEFTGKVLLKGGVTRLVVPSGVTLAGDKLEALGTEPQTKAQIFGVTGNVYSVKLSGTGSLGLANEPGEAANSGAAADRQEDSGQPQIKQTMPRIYSQLYVILGLSLAILALGFVMLYRSQA